MELALDPLQLAPVPSAAWAPTLLSWVHLWWEPAPTVQLAPMAQDLGLHQLPLVFSAGWVPTLLSRVHL